MKEKDALMPEDGNEDDGKLPVSNNTEQEAEPPVKYRHWYSQDEMAAKLGMHPNTLKQHRMKRHIGYSKPGAKIFYTEEDYQKFLLRFYKGPLLLLWVFSWLADSVELAIAF